MKKHQLTIAFAVLTAIATAPLSWAGGFTNTFNSGADYVADGILGTSALWDGIYLNDGDVTGGTGSGGGATLQASENIFPGYLTVQSTLGGWEGATDDGFFIYKLVAGDFDVSVQNAAPFDAQNYTFSGLLVRAAEFQDGSPLGGSEDFLGLVRFQEFGLGEGVKTATNGVDNVVWLGGDNSDTNSNRYLRITRVGDVFSFYNKTNEVDAWNLITTQTRDDLTGLPMQVGIQQAVYTPNEPVNYFANFALSGPNVATLTPPADPSGVAVSTVNSNTINLSWTPGAGSDGSVVLIRANGPITHKPGDGFVYVGNTNFGDAAGILGGGGVHSVYVGTGSSVTVSGMGGSNNVYSVAVYSYSGTGVTTAYGINPASSVFLGPGQLQSVDFSISPTTIPEGGVAIATLTASYTSGDSYDVSAAAGTVWQSSNPSVIAVANGVLTGVSVGSATITATYEGISGDNVVNVVTPAFSDNFGTTHDYLASGVPGSKWDGVYLRQNDLPNGDGLPFNTLIATANGLTNNALVVRANNTAWAAADDHGVLLFKNVSGDFQASVHIQAMDRLNYQFAGLMARAAEANGAPLGGNENWLYFAQFSEFGISVQSRDNVNNGNVERNIADGDELSNFYLLMRRSGNVFTFFRKINPGDDWQPLPSLTIVRDDLSGLPVQVGLFQAIYTANTGQVVFDSFMLNAEGLSTGTLPTPPSGLNFSSVAATSMDINWTPGVGSTGSVVVVRASGPVSAQPIPGTTYTGNATFGAGSQLGYGNFVVYVGTGNSVTVTGLTPGTQYYVAVYSYGGLVGSPTYNTDVDGATGDITVGIPESISVVLPEKIPNGGIGRARVVVNYSGGYSTFTTTGLSFSSDDTNIVSSYTASSLLTGLSNGTATVTAIYTEGATSLTNSATATVAAPTYTDDFSASHNYLSGGVGGTIWDGMYTNGSIPGTTYVSDGLANIAVADASISSNNTLTVTTLNVGWEGSQNDGFFLFKNVPGDFQVAVHVQNTLLEITETATNVVAVYNTPGLLSRAYTGNGSPFVGGTNESWISWTRFSEFGIGTYARRTLSNGTLQSGQPSATDNDYWLLMRRTDGTNFSFFQRAQPTDPWKPCPNGTTYNVAAFLGQPMQVGIQACAFNSGVTATAQFDSFLLDVITPKPSLNVIQSGADVVVSWPEGPGTLQSTLSLLPANWQNVAATLVTNTGTVSVSLPATNSAAFFRLAQ